MTSTQVLTAIGFAFILVGMGFAGWALWLDMTAHGRWSGAQCRLQAMRSWFGRLPSRLMFWRPKPVTLDVHSVHQLQASDTVGLTESVHVEKIPAEETTEQKFARLFERIDQLLQIMHEVRQVHGRDIYALRGEIGTLATNMRSADEHVTKLAEALALDTVPLQMRGLILVGFGTLLTALPPMLGW
jgi:hypothetical protein